MPDRVLRKFGKRITLLRERTGLSQSQLAKESGIARVYIVEIERGRRNPTLRNLVRLAEALQVPADQLLKGVG